MGSWKEALAKKLKDVSVDLSKHSPEAQALTGIALTLATGMAMFEEKLDRIDETLGKLEQRLHRLQVESSGDRWNSD